MNTITKLMASIFNYLNDLRKSGVKNMFNVHHITNKFKIDKEVALIILDLWTLNYNDNKLWNEGDKILG